MLADTHRLPVIALTLVSIGLQNYLELFILGTETQKWYPLVYLTLGE
jgi:hypothetical protein